MNEAPMSPEMPSEVCCKSCRPQVVTLVHRIDCVMVFLRNLRVWHIGKARRTLSKAMQKDPDMTRAWVANIHTVLHVESDQRLTHRECDHLARRLLKHMFDVDAK